MRWSTSEEIVARSVMAIRAPQTNHPEGLGLDMF
jgi:hypothetical protein